MLHNSRGEQTPCYVAKNELRHRQLLERMQSGRRLLFIISGEETHDIHAEHEKLCIWMSIVPRG
jgi:hypothetical protein